MGPSTVQELGGIPPSSQMFVLAGILIFLLISLISVFGSLFLKVLKNQSENLKIQAATLTEIKVIIQKQVDVEEARIVQSDKVADIIAKCALDVALHRQATEVFQSRRHATDL